MTKTKKPKMIESVGAFYYALNNVIYDKESFDEIIKSPVIKKVSVEPEGDSTTVRASGQDYDNVNSVSSIGIEVETIAFDPGDLSHLKGEPISKNGLISGGQGNERPFFACGWPVKKVGGEYTFKWYPKCKLVEDSEDAETSDTSFKEQTSTQKIIAYSFDENNTKYMKIDSEIANTINVTEEKFFSKVIMSDEDLLSVSTSETPSV